ncbi:hypothetical protein Godav_019320, partial [Gossypium davidsonii]|nr:hypothetical protein [Gossypium davidsonii]
MLKYDDTDSSNAGNSENTELFKNQSDEEKTSIDQNEDIKVSTYNSDEEKTSSEEEIKISEPMDTEPTDPYGKKRIESDSQTNDYLIRDLDKVQNTTSILTSKIKNLTIDEQNSKNIGKLINKNLLRCFVL